MTIPGHISTRAGSRIRERRLEAGIAQAELARKANISASYLNLIEHNRRRIGGKLLLDIAQALKIAPQLLSEGAEFAKIEALRAVAARTDEVAVETERSQEFAERFPGWTNLVIELSARIDRLEATVARLSDRLTHDPHLAASLHEMISTITAIRSSAAILKETPDLEPQWRARFQRNLFEESERLVEGSRRLASYLDSSGEGESRQRGPQDEYQLYLRRHNFRFAQLEPGTDATPEDVLGTADMLTSVAARKLVLGYLRRYQSDAIALPFPRLAEAMENEGGDPVRAAGRLGLSLPVVLRRIAAQPVRRGAPEPGLVICDGSGALAYAKPAEGFEASLLGHACPLWPLYLALQRPMVPIRQIIELPGPGGGTFLTWTFAEVAWPGGVDAAPLVQSTMLIESLAEPAGKSLSVGMACAICPRTSCAGRHEPSILSTGL